jgi:hypothetical protein
MCNKRTELSVLLIFFIRLHLMKIKTKMEKKAEKIVFFFPLGEETSFFIF